MNQTSPISWILSRRSIRKYNGKQIPDTDIQEILKAAMFAPSAVNCQPWHFIVTSSKELFESIMKIHPYASFLMDASHAILVCGDENLQHDIGYYQLDCSAATQNILLSSHSMGIGSCWIGIEPRIERKEKFKSLFKLPEHIQPFALISLGYTDKVKSTPDRYKADRVHHDHWGNKKL
jgi:nitroreductase